MASSLPAMQGSPEEPSSTGVRLRNRYGLVLAAIVLTFGIQGIAAPGAAAQILVSLLLGATLLLALWATDTKPRIVYPALILVVAMTIASVAQTLQGGAAEGATRAENALLVALAPPAIIIGVIRDLRARGTVTAQAVLGVLSVYLLIGMFFASVYGALDRLQGTPFFAGGEPASVARCLYYSFTTLTTVGYGDLTARTNLGHTLSVSEALMGQIYLVTVVSLVVANVGRGRREPR